MDFDSLPSVEQLEKELKREKRIKNYGRALRSTLFTLIVVAAAAILVVVLFLPVIRISGPSMSPTLSNGDILMAANIKKYQAGDIVAFYYNNNLMVKRVVAVGDDVVDINKDGYVFINGTPLREDYLDSVDLGKCDLDFPYTVPTGSYFVMGDNRYTSVDSRASSFGCIDNNLVAGKIVFRVWPFSKFGPIR